MISRLFLKVFVQRLEARMYKVWALCPLKSPDIIINLSGLSLHVKWRRPGSKADTLVSLPRMRVLKFQFYISKFVLLLSIMVS